MYIKFRFSPSNFVMVNSNLVVSRDGILKSKNRSKKVERVVLEKRTCWGQNSSKLIRVS